MLRSFRNSGWFLCAFAVLFLGVARNSWAQEVAPVVAGGIEVAADDLYPKISRRQLDRYERMLKLDEEQKETVGILFEGYSLAMREKQTAYREMFQAYMKSMEGADWSDPGSMDRMRDSQRKFMEDSQQFQKSMVGIDDGFLADIKSVLREDQAEAYPRVDRARLREMVMRQSQFGGLGVDLYETLETIFERKPMPPEVEEAVVRYEEDLERPLRDMWKWGLEMQEKQADMMDDLMAGDMTAMQEIFEGVSGMMKAVNVTSRDHRRRISNILSEDMRAKFENEYNTRAHPDVYAESTFTKAAKSAAAMGSLSDDQRTRLTELRSAYDKQAATVNQSWADTVDQQKDELGMQYYMTMAMGNDEINAAVEKRNALDKEFRNRLEAILTAEQRAELPEHEEVNANPWADLMEMNMGGEAEDPKDGDW